MLYGGTVVAAASAMIYKIWRILKSDRNADNLENAERSFREEMREEIRKLKEDNRKLEDLNQKLMIELNDLKSKYHFCTYNHPRGCPIFDGEILGSDDGSNGS